MTGLPLGLVLAGGMARRMGGGDKSLRLLAGRPLLAHVLEGLQPQCCGLLLNANGDAGRLASWNLPVVPDEMPGHPGPLAGILAGLDWAATHRPQVTQVMSVAADTPFIPHDLTRRLMATADEAGAACACAASGGRTHPVIALWSVSLRGALRIALQRGEGAVYRFAHQHGVVTVAWSTDPVDPFFNVNTPEDLLKAEELWTLSTQPPMR